jgi:hypothetical protein
MLKRVLSITGALIGTIVGLVIYWVIFMPWFHGPIRPWMKMSMALIEIAVAAYLFVRWRGWPALLLLVGSIPMVLVNIDFVGWLWRMDRMYGPNPRRDSAELVFLFPSDNEPSLVNAILHYLIYFSIVCLPISFFWYLLRLTDQRMRAPSIAEQ